MKAGRIWSSSVDEHSVWQMGRKEFEDIGSTEVRSYKCSRRGFTIEL